MLRKITVCYDTLNGEISSWAVQSSPCDIKDFECCFIESREYDLLEMPYSQDLEERLASFEKVLVNTEKKKIIYKDYRVSIRNVAWSQINTTEQRQYTIDDLKKMYYDHYVNFNLGKLIDLSVHAESLMELKWIKITDIQLRDSILIRPWKKFHTDPFLNKYHGSKIDLAKDILLNGNLWPNVTSIDYVERQLKSGDTGLFSFEGNHRVPALLLAQARGLTPTTEHRVFSIHFTNADKGYYWCKRSKEHKLPMPIRQRLPIDVAFGTEYNSDPEYKTKCDDIMNDVQSLTKIDNMTVEITVDNWLDLVAANQVYPHYLRDIIAEHNESSSEPFKGHELFSDKNYIEKWSKIYAPSYHKNFKKEDLIIYSTGSYSEDEW